MFPFLYAPTYEYPLSGDVIQGISPSFSWEMEGIPEVEYEVCTTVASYGKQLGKITEALLVIAEQSDLAGPEIDALREIAAGVEAAKLRARDAARERLQKAEERVAKLEAVRGDT